MNAQDMIELNNKKRELLTSENEAAYGDMLVYLRISNVPEQQMEELLLEILDHLIEAQAENKNAYDIFGDNLQSYCDELISALPTQTKLEKASLIGFSISLLLAIQFGINAIISFFMFFFEKNNTLSSPPFSILGTTLSVSIIILGILFILYLLKRYSFNQKMNWKKKNSIWIRICYSILFRCILKYLFPKATLPHLSSKLLAKCFNCYLIFYFI